MLVHISSNKLVYVVILSLLCITIFVFIFDVNENGFDWLYAETIYLIWTAVYIAQSGFSKSIIPFSVPLIIIEVTILKLSMHFFNKNRISRSKDRLDTLLDESKDILRQTNEYLEKWRLRREAADDYYNLDECLDQDVKPTKVEVPILHMAIVDTLGTTRSSPERGDAGDTINIKDTTLFSFTSLLEGEIDDDPDEAFGEENNSEDFNNYDV